MKRHSFGAPVQCGRCGRPTRLVLADTWEEAAGGNGLCPSCENTAQVEDGRALEQVHGIGPARAVVLAKYHGVCNLEDLAGLSPHAAEVLASRLAVTQPGVTEEQVQDWCDQAARILHNRSLRTESEE